MVSQTDLSRTRYSLHDTLVHVTGENDPHKTVESYRLQSTNAGLGRDKVDPTAAQNGIRILHSPAIDVPRISGRLPSYSMQEGRTANSEPRWDRPLYFVVRRNDAQYPSISFFPHDGLGAGVAMGLAFYQEGMLMKQSSIESCLPPILRDIEFLPFTLRVSFIRSLVVKHTNEAQFSGLAIRTSWSNKTSSSLIPIQVAMLPTVESHSRSRRYSLNSFK